MSRPLFLAGFMGTGKSTVGRLCAQRLGFDFRDADEDIARAEGMSVPDIFERKGELYFRALEADYVAEISRARDVVVATGGGMVADEVNRRTILTSGICIGLTASPAATLERLGPDAATHRPMLRGHDPVRRIAELQAARARAYAELHYTIDTTALTESQVADRACAIFADEDQRIAVVHPAGAYDIVIGEGVLSHLGFALCGRGYTSAAVVTDSNVAPLYAEQTLEALRVAGVSAFVHVFEAGEMRKNLRTVEGMYAAMAERGVERNSVVVALGGGVVGDAAGFAAATFLRGLPLVQVPTSLLAMADSSVGGKVGVDTDFGKNLVGSFKQPEFVLMDLDCLQTLPDVEIACGLAEIVKAGIIKGGAAWDDVRLLDSSQARPPTKSIVTNLINAIELKREVVQEDPFEVGRRALLNFGHTFGHAIEAWSEFRIRHGLAVSLGMATAARLSARLSLCAPSVADDVIAALRRVGLPTRLGDLANAARLSAFDISRVWELMQRDKKKRSGALRFVLVRAPGDVFVHDRVSEADAKAALATLLE